MTEQEELRAEIVDIVRKAGPAGISEDGIYAVLALREAVLLYRALEETLLSGKVEARFTGKTDADRDNVDCYDWHPRSEEQIEARRFLAQLQGKAPA